MSKKEKLIARLKEKPKDFTFDYVDMSNMSNVMNISSNVIYANTFYGIYIKNDILHMHDIVQYDIFKQAFFINQCNIYDGGNGILVYSNNFRIKFY